MMQLAAVNNPLVGTLTLSAYNSDGGYWVKRTVDLNVDASAKVPSLAPGTSLKAAVLAGAAAAAASTSPAGTPLGRAFGVVQAAEGVYELRALTFTLGGQRYPAFIDGEAAQKWGVDSVSASSTQDAGALLALVGVNSWIDLTAATQGTPQPLPA